MHYYKFVEKVFNSLHIPIKNNHTIPIKNEWSKKKINVLVVYRADHRELDRKSFSLFLSLLRQVEYFHIKVVIMQHHTLKEQITITSQAGILIGSHGMGLSHVLWLRQWPRLLVEIFPSNSYMNDYQLLAACTGARHFAWDAKHGLWHGSQYLLTDVCPSSTYKPYGDLRAKTYKLYNINALINMIIDFSTEYPLHLDNGSTLIKNMSLVSKYCRKVNSTKWLV